MRVRTAWILALVSLAVFALAVPAGALPAVLEQAKKQGVIGEQANGYLGFVKGKKGSAQVSQSLKQVNDQRRGVYQQQAAKKGTDLATYAAVVGQKQIKREPKGHWVRTQQGWSQK
jgi:uncharacterized protein YdbL (DUF1318 family)